MRYGLILAAALAVTAAAAMATTSARADDEWCGYATGDKALIECGYSSVAQCETAVGKGGMCFINPDYASLNGKHTTPLHTIKASTRPS